MTAIMIEPGCMHSLLERIQRSPSSSLKISSQRNPTYGFVIGHRVDDTDFVIHLVRLSEKFRLDSTSIELPNKNAGPKLSSVSNDGLIDEDAALLHAKHIYRMLPGGTNILGMFTVANKKQLMEYQATVSRLALTICRMNHCNLTINDQNDSKSLTPNLRFLILGQDLDTKKTTATVTRFLDGQRQPAVSVPMTEKRTQLVRIRCPVSFDLKLSMPAAIGTDGVTAFDDRCRRALRPFVRRVNEAIVTFDGSLRDVRDKLPAPSKQRSTPAVFDIDARLLLPSADPAPDNDSGHLADSRCSKMDLKGNMLCLVQLTARATYGDARRALLADLTRGLGARLLLHTEGMNVVEAGADEPGAVGGVFGDESVAEAFHRLPRRAFVCRQSDAAAANDVQHAPMLACDYLFETETTTDAARNFSDVLELDVSPVDGVVDGLELVPDEDALFHDLNLARHHKADSVGSMESVEQLAEIESRLRTPAWLGVYILTACLVAAVAWLLYFLSSATSNS